MKQLLIFKLCFLTLLVKAQTQYKYSGWVKDSLLNEPLPGATISLENNSVGTITNIDGYFEFRTSTKANIKVSMLGYVVKTFPYQTKPYKIFLSENNQQLNTVTINGSVGLNQKPLAGMHVIGNKHMNMVPKIAGETDIIRTSQLMPGLKSGAEGLGGIYARGGNADQNLMLYDDITIYNPTHLVGFFSVFNSNVISEGKIYKGNFPAAFGGRISSVFDIKSMKPSLQNANATIQLGVMAANLSVSTPIIKNKTAILFGARRSYLNQLFKLAGNELPYHFNDYNLNISHKLSQKEQLTFTAYFGEDVLNISGDKNQVNGAFGSNMQNSAYGLFYQKNNNQKHSKTGVTFSNYEYGFTTNLHENYFSLSSQINDLGFLHQSSIKTKNFELKSGIAYNYILVEPNKTTVNGIFNESIRTNKPKGLNQQSAAIFSALSYKKGKFNYEFGARLSNYFNNNFYRFYLEPRLLVQHQLTEKNTLNFSYNMMTQPLHLITGTSISMPSDIWFPSTEKIHPQIAHQLSVGHSYTAESWNLNTEAYFKKMLNQSEYKEGTIVFMNDQLEQEILQGEGRSYGLEIMAQKQTGKLTGWVSYTLSWSQRRFKEINNNEWYYARFDRRNDLSIVANYQLNSKIFFNTALVWSTGSRVTPIIGSYLMPSGSLNELLTVPIYGKRNQVNLSDMIRLDLGLTFQGKLRKKYATEFQMGVYNAFNRTQPYRVKINQQKNKLVYEQLGLFGLVPSISYQIKF